MLRAPRLPWLFRLLLPAVLASCATPMPESVDPPMELPAQFSRTGGPALAERWWEDFDDAALTGLVEEALAGNLDLRTFWDRLAQFEVIARRTGAARDVQLAATAEVGASVNGRQSETQGAESYGVGFAASYELDVWGRLEAREKAALLDAEASFEEVKAAAISLSALVAETWYRLVEQRAQLELLGSQVESNERVLSLIELRFRQGQFAAADVLRQRQLTEATRADRVRAESREQVLVHQLAVLLGRAPGAVELEPRRAFGELAQIPDTGVPAALVQRRPDIREAYTHILAADRRVAEAVADRYPRFFLTGIASTGGPRLGGLFDTWFASLVLNAAAPILDGGRRKAEVELQRAVVSERIHEYGQVILEAFQEVEDALVQERQQRALIESLDAQLDLSRRVLERLRDRYTGGAVNYIDVLQALVSLQSLQRTRLTAQRELFEYRIGLCRALAGGWTMARPAPAVITAGRSGEAEEATSGS